MVPRQPKRAQRGSRSVPRGPPREPQGFSKILAFSLFRLSDAPRLLKKLPRPPQDSPRSLQEGP
eukprot:8630852-Pyramimonas_sp.AAC.1